MAIRTKIICTMGPAVNSLDKILQLIDAGMNVARLNFSHGSHDSHRDVIENLKKARQMRKVPLAILMDTKGPEIRLGQIKGDAVNVEPKQRILLVKKTVEGDDEQWSVCPGFALNSVPVGASVLFDDGYITSKVIKKTKEGVLIEIQNAGVIRSRKSMNVPGVNINLPAMTDQDVKDILFGCKEDVDYIAASFIRSAEHVREIKKLLASHKRSDIHVIAKIESSLGVKNFDSIVRVADGIMVARGDLGVELPLKLVPSLQKMMIRKCYQACKPVVTATQMLESMIKNPRPTRAEVSDVANAIYDSTSCVMLSGETAVGLYPVETVAMMRSVVEEAEANFPYRDFFDHATPDDLDDISASVSLAAVKTAYSASAKAIFAFTSSGFTARLISRFRPQMPIIALTSSMKTYHQLSFNWGVVPVEPKAAKNIRKAFEICTAFAKKKKIVRHGDRIVLTAGSSFGISGTTNTMIVEQIDHRRRH